VILDADGLNIIASHPYLTTYYTENIVITPHLGEMARLTGESVKEIQADLPKTALEYAARYGLTCVLKDAATVVAGKEGSLYINTSGDSAMAKAGSGDVLTGILAGLMAMGLEVEEAACLGVYLHGLSGEAAAKAGRHSLLASELANAIGEVMS
jgi:NAD(P)H-hydrate epimerase